MAATKTILKLTTTDAIVRIVATQASDEATIDLSTDLKMTNETLAENQTVYVTSICHQTGTNLKLTRNSKTVGQYFSRGTIDSADFVLTDEATHDITATFAGEGMVILRLRKVSGYNTPFEPATFGAYDNPTQVGS